MPHLSEINVYPVKSLRGLSLTEARVERRGLEFDRRWLVVDPAGRFVSQRVNPLMATVSTEIVNGSLVLRQGDARFEVPAPSDRRVGVTIWNDRCEAQVCSDETSEWLSRRLGIGCRLVSMPETTIRKVDPDFAVKPSDHVSFADGFPFLLIGQASLDDLNGRLDVAVPMDRFRPNLVIGGSDSFAEDDWNRIRIGDAEFDIVKPCSRCSVTTVDQQTGENAGPEPLRTLAAFRTFERNGAKKIFFGQNLVSGSEGSVVRVGDAVEILG